MNHWKQLAPACTVLLVACGGGSADQPRFTVTYRVDGPPPLEVSWRDASGELLQARSEATPFSRDVVVAEGAELFVSGRTPALTFVTASITADGTLLMAGAARGSATARATCCAPAAAP